MISRRSLDSANLKCRNKQRNVSGEILIYTKENVLSDEVKKFYCDGWVRVNYSLDADVIYTQDGHINMENLEKAIRKLLGNLFNTNVFL